MKELTKQQQKRKDKILKAVEIFITKLEKKEKAFIPYNINGIEFK